jgi:hypothetical protein
MSLLLLSSSKGAAAVKRTGLVTANYHVVSDAGGPFHPLGLTFFWALYGWKYERSRIMAHLEWLAPKGFDYLRILGEVDWTDRSIEPNLWPDYTQVLTEFVDCAYDRFGLRTELTILGGRQYDKNTGDRRYVPVDVANQVATALEGRQDKIMHYECANEWDRLDKVTGPDLVAMAEEVERHNANLVTLSRPGDDGYAQLMEATGLAGASGYTLHPRRSDHDHGWSHVRQGYDFKDFDRCVWNNEPEGPQSSVDEMSNPLQLACCRLLGIMCGGAGYVLHVGQGVTGEADPDHDRPQDMWDVPNIDYIMAVVRQCDPLMPPGVENWHVANNGRSEHPLPLDGHSGFWEGSSPGPAVNKNYAALSGDQFVVMLTGCKSAGETGPVPAGTAIKRCHVEAYDPVSLALVKAVDLEAGQSWDVPGRGDTMSAYVIRGRYV